ncbi:hypothetical protein BJX65DRAFT_114210 [Aspergillus insuetus]
MILMLYGVIDCVQFDSQYYDQGHLSLSLDRPTKQCVHPWFRIPFIASILQAVKLFLLSCLSSSRRLSFSLCPLSSWTTSAVSRCPSSTVAHPLLHPFLLFRTSHLLNSHRIIFGSPPGFSLFVLALPIPVFLSPLAPLKVSCQRWPSPVLLSFLTLFLPRQASD